MYLDVYELIGFKLMLLLFIDPTSHFCLRSFFLFDVQVCSMNNSTDCRLMSSSESEQSVFMPKISVCAAVAT